jgi:hypothetical protein
MLGQHAIDAGAWMSTMLATPLSHGADTVNSHVEGFLTTVYYGPNDGPNALSTAGTGFTMTQVETAMYGSIDQSIGKAATSAGVAAGLGKILHNYEGGCGIQFGNATYQQSVMDDPGCYLPQCYWLNENRRALPNSYCAYHEFVGKVDTGHGSYGLLYDVNNTINSTQFSRALALSDALAGNYSLFDPTFTSAGLVFDSAPSGTLVSTATKGLLPEAALSLTGTGNASFSVAWATDSNGSKVAQTKTVGTVAAGTYSLNLVQTYTNPVTGLQTKTTAIPTITITADTTLRDNFNGGSIDGTKWGAASNVIVNANTAQSGATATQTGGEMVLAFTGTAASSIALPSANTFDLTQTANASTYVKITSVANTGRSFGLAFKGAGSIGFQVDLANGFTRLYKSNGTTSLTQLGSASALTIAAYPWVRLRVVSSQIYVDRAPSTASNPPLETDWVNQLSAVDMATNSLPTTVTMGPFLAA